MPEDLIYPKWPDIPGVHAVSTTRKGGASRGVYSSFNLGDHVGDSAELVQSNRRQLAKHLMTRSRSFQWLSQIHGIGVHTLEEISTNQPIADAAFTSHPQLVCAVLTADCLPVLFASRDGCQVAVAHAGWRGLLQGILEATVSRFTDPENLQVWLGPAIGPAAFEIGSEVYMAFVAKSPLFRSCFAASKKGRWLADIYQLARIALASVGVRNIYGGGLCTLSDPARFFSYRRDGVTGRMATLIWKS